MLKFKPGVKLVNLQPQMLIAIQVVEAQMNILQVDTVVTSGNDSTHKEGSLHYSGRALDFRTKDTGRNKAVADGVKKDLAPIGFDVILEDLGGVNEHLHVEYDPK